MLVHLSTLLLDAVAAHPDDALPRRDRVGNGMLTRFGHNNVFVRDIDATIAFYRLPLRIWGSRHAIVLDPDGNQVGLKSPRGRAAGEREVDPARVRFRGPARR
jgi:hypothetical protein